MIAPTEIATERRPRPLPPTAAPEPTAAPATPPAPTFLRLSAGFVYFYFGLLKLFPDLSPAEVIAGETLMRITAHAVNADVAIYWLAVVESAIGLCFLFNFHLRWVFFLFLAHQASTFLPLFILPELTFKIAPFAPTMEGQYILKNLISLAAGWTVLWPAVKAGHAARRADRAQALALRPR